MTDPVVWQSMGVALAVGLLVGSERERSKHETGSPGVRTFALVSLVGAVAATVTAPVGAALVGGVVLMLVVSYLRSFDVDPGMTSEVAAVLTLGLGALAVVRPALSTSLAVAVTVLLAGKETLHRFLRDTVTEVERTDALRFFVAAFVVLPLLPSRPVGPYDVLVPHKVWVLVVLITGIGFVGYAATRALGPGRGLMLTGLAGGFVSGTATTGSMAARSRDPSVPLAAPLAGALLASLATLAQLVVVTTVAAPEVAGRLVLPCAAGSAVLLTEVVWLTRRQGGGAHDDAAQVKQGRPFALGPALVLAAVISCVLLFAAWMTHHYGSGAATLATGAGALADVHAASVAVATLARDGEVAVVTALHAIALGLATNTVGKLVFAWVGGGHRFALRLLALLVPVALAVAGGVVLVG
jgi:uncharacterized membrane protein (DUF4010 family)